MVPIPLKSGHIVMKKKFKAIVASDKISSNPLKIGSYCNKNFLCIKQINLKVPIPLKSGHIVIMKITTKQLQDLFQSP